MAPRRPLVVAAFNTSPDLIDLVRSAFEPAGIVVVSLLTFQIREGGVDLKNFLVHHDPQVVVYDIAPPYEANWQLFQHIRSLHHMKHRKVVLTSINRKHVEKLVGRDETIYEIVGKPYDLNRLVHAVKEAARQRPSR
jgi:DNA-binding response OmpR family regulator